MTKKKEYKRNCPICNQEIVYKSYSGYYNANRNNSNCKDCYIRIAGKSRSRTWAKRREGNVYKRNCPECGKEIVYSSVRTWRQAENNDSKCRKCYSKTISETLKEKFASGEIKIVPVSKDFRERKKYWKLCPNCQNKQWYTRKNTRDNAQKQNTICNSCAAYHYNKTFNDVITEDSIKKMRASKAGFNSWEEYVNKYPEKQFYKREVWRLTYQQPIEELPNFELRGRCGVKGAYQIDHIVSINEGYEQQIDPKKIAHISNLRMIPWEENRRKG